MSTSWSMYVVPDNWTLRDCVCVSYMHNTMFMMSDKQFKRYFKYKQKNDDRLYDELMKQPAIYDFTSDDGGDPDYDKIMELLSLVGRLYSFPDELYKLIPKLEKFAEDHKGKRYICSN